MRSLMVIIDGLGDDPIDAFGGRTPFEYARHPNIDKLLKKGSYSEISICGSDFPAESLGCILRLLGVGQKDFPLNRAYLELLANGRDISEYEMVLRCNLASVDEAVRLVSFNAMGLTAKEMAEAAAVCNKLWQGIEFLHLSEYRNLLILDNDRQILHDCRIAPPHESMGLNIDMLLSDLKARSLLLKTFIDETTEKLKPFARNGISYRIYPWGPSERKLLPAFYDLHGIKGAAVCKAEIVRGIARALKMPVPDLPTATADIDTDVCAKAGQTIKFLKDYDFVVTHFNGSDEAAHRYDYTGKANFITRIDEDFIGPVLKSVKEPLKILICGDHVTSCVTGKHSAGNVPVIAAAVNCDNNAPIIGGYHDIHKFLMGASD